MGKPRFTEEFKIETTKQITERGCSVADVSQRLGVSTHSLLSDVRHMNTSYTDMHSFEKYPKLELFPNFQLPVHQF